MKKSIIGILLVLVLAPLAFAAGGGAGGLGVFGSWWDSKGDGGLLRRGARPMARRRGRGGQPSVPDHVGVPPTLPGDRGHQFPAGGERTDPVVAHRRAVVGGQPVGHLARLLVALLRQEPGDPLGEGVDNPPPVHDEGQSDRRDHLAALGFNFDNMPKY